MSDSHPLIDPDKLRMKRIRASLTPPALARAAGVDPSYIRLIEAARRGGSPETLNALARVLGCDITDLMPDKKAGKAGVRTYKPRAQLDKDRRMAVAVRLTAEGLSLREIAAELSISYMTVARDLERWKQVRASLPLAIVRLSQPVVTPIAPGATNVTPACDSRPTNVIPLRRSA